MDIDIKSHRGINYGENAWFVLEGMKDKLATPYYSRRYFRFVTIPVENVIKFLHEKYKMNYTFIDTTNVIVTFDGVIGIIAGRNDDIGAGQYINTWLYGDESKLKAIGKEFLDYLEQFTAKVSTYVNWAYFDGQRNIRYVQLPIKARVLFDPAFYPFIDNVDDFMLKFKDSSANVLILNGPPGTGKTSFITNMIAKMGYSAMTTYDEQVMQSDAFHTEYLSGNNDVMVLEDSDTFMRGKSNVLSKFLNISDGIMDTSKKKIILTANISNVKEIDEALIRPGRCFSLVNFRTLTKTEAQEVVTSLGKEMPEARKEYTLAELFNDKIEVEESFGNFGFLPKKG
jgi:hypothetical protein